MLAAIGLVAGMFLARRCARLLSLNADDVWNAWFAAIAIYFCAGFLLRVIFILLMHKSPAAGLNIPVELVPFWFIAFCAAGYLRARRVPLLSALAASSPAFALLAACLSFGDFASGKNFGLPTSLPWGVVFHSQRAVRMYGTRLNLPLHPVQLYACAASLLICAALLWLITQRKQAGEIFGAWLFLTGTAMFVTEFFRFVSYMDWTRWLPIAGWFPLIDLRQVIALLMIALGGAFWLQRPSKEKTHAL